MYSAAPYQARSTIIDGNPNTFKGVKDCDTEFVGVALQSTSTLVTVDQRLKLEIKKDLLFLTVNVSSSFMTI